MANVEKARAKYEARAKSGGEFPEGFWTAFWRPFSETFQREEIDDFEFFDRKKIFTFEVSAFDF